MKQSHCQITDIGLGQLPRLAGFMDRLPQSTTYGCADRNFWHYKVIDFANARFQEVSLAFALAHEIKTENNRFYKNPQTKAWSDAAASFWVKSCHANGAVDESYPLEKHFCATAFGLWSITESRIILKEPLIWNLSNMGNFLLKHHSEDVANQSAAAAAALYNLFVLTNEQKYKVGFEQKIEMLLAQQSSDGCFIEYGGFDLGYDTVTLSLLANLYEKSKQIELKAVALRCLKHLEGFVTANGSFASKNMSRQTQFIYPYGMKVFNSLVYAKVQQGLSEGAILNPQWMDDRYCVPLTINYLQCADRQGAS